MTKADTGVHQYDWFLNEGQTTCVVHEAYRDRDALLEHIARTSRVFAILANLGGGCELQLFSEQPVQLGPEPAGVRRTVFAPLERT